MGTSHLTLLTDLYELTMMQGYFKNPTDQTVVFDMFYRDNPCGGAFAICAGLEQMIEYIENLRFSEEDITYLRSLGIFEDDFLEYISKLWSMLIWGNKKYVVDKIVADNGFGNVKKQLADLLYGDGAIEKRWDTFLKNAKGLGPATILSLIHI